MTARQRSLLVEEPPLQVLPALAKLIGLNEAIILQQIHYWLGRSENERDGRKFVYKTTQEWAEEFPFWSEPTIKRAIAALKALGLIVVTKKAANSWQRTNWYSVDYEALSRIGSKCADALDQIDPKHEIKESQSTGSKRSDRTDQSDPITLTTETTSETTAKKPAAVRPGVDYIPSPSVLAWVKKNGFEPWLQLHVEEFRDTCATQERKPYTVGGLDAAFRKCVRGDWGGVRKQAQMAARHGQQSGVPANPAEWWKTQSGISAKGVELGVERKDNPEWVPGENWMWFRAQVCAAAGDGPWCIDRDEVFQQFLAAARKRRPEKVAHV